MILRQEIQLADLIAQPPSTQALRDDRPINEYYTLRRHAKCGGGPVARSVGG
jgi:hypothetical protein